MNLRDAIKIIEGMTYESKSYWYNPKTKQVINVIDHDVAVMDDPAEFGISDHVVEMMATLFPDDESLDNPMEIDSFPEMVQEFGLLPLSGGDAWERLAMNRGWVRCCESAYYASFVNAANIQLLRYAVAYMRSRIDQFPRGIDLELINAKQQQFKNLKSMEDIEDFIEKGKM